MTEDLMVFRLGFGDAGDRFFRHDQDVRGRARIDVLERQHFVVLEDDRGGDLARDDFFEKRFAHGYRTTSAQVRPATSAERHVRRYSTMWSLRRWHLLPQRLRPINCFTQPRKPRNSTTVGASPSLRRSSSRSREKKISSNPLPD